MAEIWFYHLQSQPLEEVLPGLLEKSLARGWCAAVQTQNSDQMKELDALLWTFQEESFLPHGCAGDPHAEKQPILISSDDENLNGAHVRFLVNDAPLCDSEPYERLILLFDGNDNQAVENARTHWKKLKGDNKTVTYWRQDDGGRWSKMA